MQNISRDYDRRVLPGKRHSGRTLYAKAQSEPYAREENTTAAGLPATQKKQSAPAILSPALVVMLPETDIPMDFSRGRRCAPTDLF